MRVSLAIWGLLVSGVGVLGCDPGGAIVAPGLSCNVAACSGGVHFAAELAATMADAPNLELRFCRNDLCSSLHPTADGSTCDFAGPLTAACRLSASANGLHLEVMFQGAMTGWTQGDVFAVRVGLPGVTPLVDVQRAVTYVISRPAGPDCPPVCQSASLN